MTNKKLRQLGEKVKGPDNVYTALKVATVTLLVTGTTQLEGNTLVGAFLVLGGVLSAYVYHRLRLYRYEQAED